MVRERDGQRKRRKDGGRQNFEEMDIAEIQDRNVGEEEQNSDDSDSHSDVGTPEAPGSSSVASKNTNRGNESEEQLSSIERRPLDADGKPIKTKEELDKEQGIDKKKNRALMMEKDDDLEAELAAQFASSPSSKKEKKKKEEEAEKSATPAMTEAEEKKQRDDDMARLQEIRAKREADKVKREQAAEKEEAAEKEKKKKEEKSYPELVSALEKLLPESGKKLSLNQLNQDAAAKKLLKPLLKKAEIKQLNKASLTQICKGIQTLTISEDSNVVYCERK